MLEHLAADGQREAGSQGVAGAGSEPRWRARVQAPHGGGGEAIAQIWQTLLDLPRVGRDDNFFELGGHSLAALRLVASVASKFRVRIGVAALFASPTLRAFAIRVSEFDRPPESWKIVQIQPLGRKTPIIAINNTMMYYDLARKIGSDRRVSRRSAV